MSQQIADLTINLGAETADFSQQMGRVERQLKETSLKAGEAQDHISKIISELVEKQAANIKNFSSQQSQAMKDASSNMITSINEIDGRQEISQQQREAYYLKMAQAEARAEAESRSYKDTFTEQIQKVAEGKNSLEALNSILDRLSRTYDKAKISTQHFSEVQTQVKSKIRGIQDNQDIRAENFYKQIDAVTQLSGSSVALKNIQHSLNQEVKKGTITQEDYKSLLSAVTSQSIKLRREEESLTQQKTRFIQRLKEQAAKQNLSREQMLRYEAAQLGVSSSAEIYIRRLSESSKETKEFDKNSKSLTSRLQNVANSFNMGSLLRGGIWGGVTAGLIGVAKLAYDAEREFSQFNKQLILTGNYANKSASQLNEMARTLAGGGITRGDMASSISSVVGTGVFSNNEISRVSKAAAQMNYITGQAVNTTIDQFKRLQDEPLQMSLELEKSNHHLTAAQLEQIRTLELQGNKTEAARLAIDAYAQSINDGANDIVENLGYLESAWLGIKNAAKEGWDAMLDIGREKTLEDQIREQESLLSNLNNIWITPQYRINEIQEKIASLKEQSAGIALKKSQAQAVKDAEQFEVNKFRVREKLENRYGDREIGRNKELAQLEADKWALSTEEFKKYETEINRRWKDNIPLQPPKIKSYKVPAGDREEEKASRDLLSLQAQLEVLKEHQSANDVISQQRKDLQKEQAQFAILEEAKLTRQLDNNERSLLANKANILAQKEKLALVGDEVALQERLNKMQDQAEKYIAQQSEKRKAIEESMGKSAREQQRYLERAQLLAGQKESPYLDNMLAEQQKTYEVEDQKRADWLAGAQTAWGNYKDTALDVNSQVQNATAMALNGFSTQLTNVLVDGEANFKDFTKSILKMLTDIFIKMSLVKGIEAMGFGVSAPVANADGGVYNSASLSAYSGQIVHKPTMFAFAKGAGLMGEAGPEGIFPLRRGADGKLGVIAKMSNQGSGVTQINHITIQNDGSNGQLGPQALKQVYEIAKRGAQDYVVGQRRDGGTL